MFSATQSETADAVASIQSIRALKHRTGDGSLTHLRSARSFRIF
jgi:hypothetical protein